MLLAKLLEGIVRIFSLIGFEHSKHVVDSGLLGVLGLLGCCGPRRRSRSARSRNGYRSATAHQDSASEAAYFASPSMSTPGQGSSIQGPTPSVLRPEHAFQPYKEDADDESGFIMNAWRPAGSRGYSPVGDDPSPKPSSGFSRVGGGRAHHENPYAITPGSSKARHQLFNQPVFNDDDEEDSPATSFVSDARRPEVSSLPVGAMHPLRPRTQSQSGIIEDSSSYLASPAQGPSAPREESVSKRPWYHLKRRERPRSVGDDIPPQPLDPILDPPKAPGRSFVVVRKGQQSKPAQGPSNDQLPPPDSLGRRGSSANARRMSATQ